MSKIPQIQKRTETKGSESRGRAPIKKTAASPTQVRSTSPKPIGQIPETWHLDGDISNDPIASSILTRINAGVLVAKLPSATKDN